MENSVIVERLNKLEKRVSRLEGKGKEDYGKEFSNSIKNPQDMREGLMVYAGKFKSKDGSVGSVFGTNCCQIDNVLDFNSTELANIIDAFASAERLDIIKELMKKSCSAKELMEILKFNTTGKLYHHLSFLEKLGVVAKNSDVYHVSARFVSCILLILAGAGNLAAKNK